MRKLIKIRLAVIIATSLLFALTACGSGNGDTTLTPPTPDIPIDTQSDDLFQQDYESEAHTFIESDYDKSLSFDTLARNPDYFIGELVMYTGTILQISQLWDGSIFRIAVSGNSNNVIWVETLDILTVYDLLLEGDVVDVFGVVFGEASYETILGAWISLPGILAHRLEKVDLLSLIEYSQEPFIVTDLDFRGDVRSVTNVDAFVITSVDLMFNSDLRVGYQVTGTVSGDSRFRFDVLFFDEDGFNLGTRSISSSVIEGAPFRVDGSFHAPEGTVRIEIAN